MDLQRLIDIDKQVMLALNGSDSLYMDGVMRVYTSTVVWLPVALILLFVEGFEINIKDIELNAGSGFVVALAGDIMRMPGLSKNPQASHIRLAEDGSVEGIV